MNTVETFMEEEKSKCNWIERLFNNFPVFYFSKDISIILKDKNIDHTFIVKPSKIRRFLAIILVCLGLFGWFSIFLIVIENVLLPISATFLLFMTLWIGSIIWTFFLNPEHSYKIFIDKEKIILRKQKFELNQISEYLLMEKGGGRYLVTTLVLFTDKNVFKYNLTNLNKSGQEIIKQIEFYKQQKRPHNS